jgi:PAS domain S-box-containing protein
MTAQTNEQLQLENQRLQQRLAEAEDTLRALKAGEVDAVVVETDREQVYTLDAADKPYRLLVEQMPQGAASFTTDGVILHGNRRFASLLGQPLEKLIGRSIYDFLAPESQTLFESLLRDVQAAEVRAEVTLRRGDGTLVPAYIGINALREGPLGMCVVVTDLTEQKNYAELKLVQEAMREADRRKNEFVAILAHELRNPLGPIRNAARILKLKGPQDPELRSPIEMIERQTEQLARLLDDLLDVSRITRGALEMRREQIAFSKVVEASVDACREELQGRGVQLHVSLPAEPAELVADRARLIQVLCNLITNAAKYTPPGGKIELKAASEDGVLTVSVKDNGIGIPRERLTDIFDLFAQVDRSGDRSGGLGIGLTLVRQIAALHGGTIEARSEGIGQGSEFVLTLPVVAATAASPAPTSVSASGPAAMPRRVLIVDDNADAAESLATLLQIAGHDVHYALDGEAAIALAEQVRPDVALLDLGMPKVSGYEVARRIREQPWGKHIHLVALSGWGQAAERLRTQAAGFDVHLVKPVAPEVLNRLLDTMSDRPGQPMSSIEVPRERPAAPHAAGD